MEARGGGQSRGGAERNLNYVACNFAASAEELFERLSPALVRLITIQVLDNCIRH